MGSHLLHCHQDRLHGRNATALGTAGRGGIAASGRGDDRRSGSGSRRWSKRCGNCARPTRFCARHRLILPRRSSTARSSDERVRRRAPRRPWGRADLQSVADRPVDIPCTRPARLILVEGRPEPARRAPMSKSGGSGKTTSRSTARTRSGASYGVRVWRRLAARWSG